MAKRKQGDQGKLGKAGAELVRRRAEMYAREPGRLTDLLGRAQEKADQRRGPLAGVWEEFMLLFRMLKAYVAGSYSVIPWQSLLLIVGAILYFVMPIDLIPDALPGPGYLDDAAVVAWTVGAIRADLEAFRTWERDRTEGAGSKGEGA